jgi:hypothetical protein
MARSISWKAVNFSQTAIFVGLRSTRPPLLREAAVNDHGYSFPLS